MDRWVSKCGLMELRLGDYREVLDDVKECQSVITDPPYSQKTHEGQNLTRNDKFKITQISYDHFSNYDVNELVVFFSKRISAWICCMSDSVLCQTYQEFYRNKNLCDFAPVPCVIPGMTCRLSGDGPSSWAVYLNVARTKAANTWGTLCGAYVQARSSTDGLVIGSKPLLIMRSIVRDYSHKGELVVEPFAGSGTTLLACAIEGRRCIGSELDGDTFEKAVKRLEKGYTPLLLE